MRRNLTRFSLAALAVSSVGCLLYAANPRIYAFNQTSSAMTIAATRAQSCIVVARPLVLGMRVMAEQGGEIPMNPGTYVCDRSGNTAQISNSGYTQYIRSAPPEKLNQLLNQRGLRTEVPATVASPIPPTNP
jgi:hypothetical protein